MAYLNANIPPIYCKIRKEYLYDLTGHDGESEDCVIFGIYAGSLFKIDGGEVRILNDYEIIATISNPADILHHY